MNEIELAWAAGFYDGEGTTYAVLRPRKPVPNRGLRKRKVPAQNLWFQVAVQVTQFYSTEALERFQHAVGVGKIYGPYAQNGGLHRWLYRSCNMNDVEIVLSKLWPYLCQPKRDQAAPVLEAIKKRRGFGRFYYDGAAEELLGSFGRPPRKFKNR